MVQPVVHTPPGGTFSFVCAGSPVPPALTLALSPHTVHFLSVVLSLWNIPSSSTDRFLVPFTLGFLIQTPSVSCATPCCFLWGSQELAREEGVTGTQRQPDFYSEFFHFAYHVLSSIHHPYLPCGESCTPCRNIVWLGWSATVVLCSSCEQQMISCICWCIQEV